MYKMCIVKNGKTIVSDIRFSSAWAANVRLDDWACVTHATSGYVIDNNTCEIVHEWKPW